MARPRTFERDAALRQALELFWSRGYDAVSMSDLQRLLGIGRQSLYNTFGDKEQLFTEALEAYIGRSKAMLAAELGPDSDLVALRAYFERIIEQVTEGEPRRGCLVTNTTVGRSPHDQRTAELTGRSMAMMEEACRHALANAKGVGQIADAVDVDSVAKMLTAVSAGLAVLARGGTSVPDLRDVVEAVFAGFTR
ncbi:MAG: TetR/AcrR family transcriptional regulator [Myxococcota bacterium]